MQHYHILLKRRLNGDAPRQSTIIWPDDAGL